MIVTILELRARLMRLLQKLQIVLEPLVKFVIAFVVFRSINNAIGQEQHLMSLPVELLLSFLGTFTPPVILVLLGALVALAHVYIGSPILAILVAVLMLILYCFIARFSGKYGYVVLAVPILFFLNLPYVVPLILGLIATPMAIIPTACGVMVYRIFVVIGEAMQREPVTTIDDILQQYLDVIDELLADKQILITIAVFAVIIIAMYLIRKLSIEFIFEISVAVGTIICILGFLVANMVLPVGMNITSMVFGALGSMVIALVFQFFRMALDYTAVERVQFEDDDYYYYVKAVPKIKFAITERSVKKISDAQVEQEEPFPEDVAAAETGKPSRITVGDEAQVSASDGVTYVAPVDAGDAKTPDYDSLYDDKLTGANTEDILEEDERYSLPDTEEERRGLTREERYALGEEFFDEDEDEL